ACNGSFRIRAEVETDPNSGEILHCHVLSQLGSDTTENLTACIIGIGNTPAEQIADAAKNWLELVGSAYLTLLNQQSVLSANLFSRHSTYGIPHSGGAIGPRLIRDYTASLDPKLLNGIQLFRHIENLAPPEPLQLAKVVLSTKGGAWQRRVEINGHQTVFIDRNWKTDIPAPALASVTQFCVFHFGENESWLTGRQHTDDCIFRFLEAFETSGKPEPALASLQSDGIDLERIHRIRYLVSLAFSRFLFEEFGANYSPDYYQIKTDGTVRSQLLLDDPIYARSLMLASAIQTGPHMKAFQNLALLNSEFNLLNRLLNEGREPNTIQLEPPIVPDLHTSPAQFKKGLAAIAQDRSSE
ncbi:MAG: hypothetical protein VX438_06005, partial [Planctomycetota bacterium]|nr:hypothetical protein [Planctomycetota bacterium]